MQHNTALYDILNHHILGCFRYVDEVLTVYDASLADIHVVLNRFNTATSSLHSIIEK
jgi:hypothetical protein